jgi:hypothetical protein
MAYIGTTLTLESLACVRFRPATPLSMFPLATIQSSKRVELKKGMRTLGVRLALDGNDHDENKHRMEDATSIRDRDSRRPHSTESMLPSDSVLSGR